MRLEKEAKEAFQEAELKKKVEEQLKAVEESMKEETKKRAGAANSGGGSKTGSSKKMKAMLESFKASKEAQNNRNHPAIKSQRLIEEEKEKAEAAELQLQLQQEQEQQQQQQEQEQNISLEQTMSPLQLLRLYTIQNRKVVMENGTVYFGNIEFPKDTKTNFKVTRRNELEAQYYTLHSLVNFMEHRSKFHAQYIRDSLRNENILIVRQQDRNNVEDYLTGKIDTCPNLVAVSHKELNPDQERSSASPTSIMAAKAQENLLAKVDKWKLMNMTEKDYLKSQAQDRAIAPESLLALPNPAPVLKSTMSSSMYSGGAEGTMFNANNLPVPVQNQFSGSEYGSSFPAPVNANRDMLQQQQQQMMGGGGVTWNSIGQSSGANWTSEASSAPRPVPANKQPTITSDGWDDASRQQRSISPDNGWGRLRRSPSAKEPTARWIDEPELRGSWNSSGNSKSEGKAGRKKGSPTNIRSFSPLNKSRRVNKRDNSYEPDKPTLSPPPTNRRSKRSPSSPSKGKRIRIPSPPRLRIHSPPSIVELSPSRSPSPSKKKSTPFNMPSSSRRRSPEMTTSARVWARQASPSAPRETEDKQGKSNSNITDSNLRAARFEALRREREREFRDKMHSRSSISPQRDHHHHEDCLLYTSPSPRD